MQETALSGTAPLLVDGLNVQLTVKTVFPSCWNVTVASVKDRSVMSSVQFELGHPGAPVMGVVGPSVSTENGVVPFLISDSGITATPATVTGAGFCPGA